MKNKPIIFFGTEEFSAISLQKLIDENLIDAVIGLPANLFYGVSIPTCILVIKGCEAQKIRKIFCLSTLQIISKKLKTRIS